MKSRLLSNMKWYDWLIIGLVVSSILVPLALYFIQFGLGVGLGGCISKNSDEWARFGAFLAGPAAIGIGLLNAYLWITITMHQVTFTERLARIQQSTMKNLSDRELKMKLLDKIVGIIALDGYSITEYEKQASSCYK